MAYPPGRSSSGGGSIVIQNQHVFENVAARNAYFAIHPEELINDLYIYIEDITSLQQYKATTASWLTVEPVVGIQGDPGVDGIDGQSINVTVAATEPATSSNGDIWVDTDESLTVLADDSILWNGKARPAMAGAAGRLMVVNATADGFEFPTNVAIPGIPTAATASLNTNTTQLATTAYVYRVQPKTRQLTRCAYMTDSTNVEVKMNSCGSIDRAATTSAAGYKMFYYPFCAGGETTIDIYVSKGTTRPIIDLYVNAVLDSAGYDLYNSSTVDAIVTITLSQPIVAGFNDIRLIVNGKNSSSTAYDTSNYGIRVR